MDVELTRDAKDMLHSLYQGYKNRVKNGMSKQQARQFLDVEKLQADYFPTWAIDDISSTARELQRAGFWKHYLRQGIVLNDRAIVYMENLFKTSAAEIVDTVSKLIP